MRNATSLIKFIGKHIPWQISLLLAGGSFLYIYFYKEEDIMYLMPAILFISAVLNYDSKQ
jgi:hypothetical protein